MQVIFDTDEAWSLMSVIASQIIDRADLSSDGKAKVRRWRTDRAAGTLEQANLTVDMNDAIGSTLDEKTARLIRRQGRYVSTREEV